MASAGKINGQCTIVISPKSSGHNHYYLSIYSLVFTYNAQIFQQPNPPRPKKKKTKKRLLDGRLMEMAKIFIIGGSLEF